MKQTSASPTPERPTTTKRTRRPLTVSLGLAACLLLLLGGGFLLLRPALAWQSRARAARTAMQQGNYHKARAAWEECLEISPGSPEAHLAIARACRLTGDFKGATSHLVAARHLGGSREDVEIEQLLLRSHLGEPDQALGELMQRVRDTSPRLPEMQEALAFGYLSAGRLTVASKWTDELIKARPDYWFGYWLRGALAERQGKSTEAMQDFSQVLKLFPEQPDTRLWMARAQFKNKDYQSALENFQQLLAVKSVQAEAALGTAECYRALGRGKEALPLLANAADNPKTRGRALLQRGLLALENETPQQALEWLRQSAALPPPTVELYDGLATAFRKVGDNAQARQAEDLRNRLKSDIEEIERLGTRVRDLEVGKDQAEYLRIMMRTSELYFRIGNEERAVASLHDAIREKPDYKPALTALADYHDKKGDTDRARDYRERAR